MLKLKSGSTFHKALVVSWFFATSVLLFSLSTFGLNPAAGSSGEEPNHVKFFDSTNYSGVFWSLAEVRTTPAEFRTCFQDPKLVCNSVFVLEVISTNRTNNPVIVTVDDLALKYPSGVTYSAERFDCSEDYLISELKNKIGNFDSSCPDHSNIIKLEPNQTRSFSVLFIPNQTKIPKLNRISFVVREFHRPNAKQSLIESLS